MQAKDIPDLLLLQAIDSLSRQVRMAGDFTALVGDDYTAVGMVDPHWVFTWDLEKELPEYPWKVLLAKCRKLIKRGLLDGCTCGCRGDFVLTPEGIGLIRNANV